MNKIVVDRYIEKYPEKRTMLNLIRKILNKNHMQETIKWGMPTYTFDNKNLIGIGAFKHHVSIWFFQGGLLLDKYKILLNVQEGKTKAMRQIRFKTKSDIDEQKLTEYIYETIENHKNGLVIKSKKNTNPLILSEELLLIFKENQTLKINFDALSLGKKREYSEFINNAKRDSTKKRRIEKIIPLILDKKGLNDKYKNC